MAGTQFRGADGSFTFRSGRMYWVGVIGNGPLTIRGITTASLMNLGLTFAHSLVSASLLKRALPFASPLPERFGFVEADLASGTAPSIRFRAASMPA